jgi:hypothetical protein
MPALAALFRLLQESIVADPFDDESTAESEWARFRKCGSEEPGGQRDAAAGRVRVYSDGHGAPYRAALRLLGWARANAAEVRVAARRSGFGAVEWPPRPAVGADRGARGEGGSFRLRDVCDLAYVLILERVERQYIADRTAYVSSRVCGSVRRKSRSRRGTTRLPSSTRHWSASRCPCLGVSGRTGPCFESWGSRDDHRRGADGPCGGGVAGGCE